MNDRDENKILDEIERLENYELKSVCSADTRFGWINGKIFALTSLRIFLDSMKKDSVSEDLEEAAKNYMKSQNPPIWGLYDGFIAGAKWQKERFEKNRLKHCSNITNEQAELEQEFVYQHLDKHERIPTFLDAIEYGMRLQREQIMKDAVLETEVLRDSDGDGVETPYESWLTLANTEIPELPESLGFNEGDKVKILIVKSE